MPVWIEAALNGPWKRELQPLIPITVAECVREGGACARAGAAIIHVHAFDPRIGRQNDDPGIYAASSRASLRLRGTMARARLS